MHLANLSLDMGERTNLREAHRALAAELRAAAEVWRADIDAHWDTVWAPRNAQ